ncbi:ABC transporter substrate-binding protein [Aquabacter sp. L1I39]|uniref:ABC transporter substrate-binding protein n=1 Tax=Aquabacter sp. L1I39 TaxID=2820278 RepID=UPI001ADB7283|nr:ABC transporter substrate-binding protein [Aquabacter sp. L1I39]QTL03957.1 ABC transporter substrate-binding protein [Aquabacter sp. L1I39]
MVSAGLTRRAVLGGALSGLPLLRTGAAEIAVTDMAGRAVALKRAPERIVLLDARDAVSMALFVRAPMERVAGWAGLDGLDSDALLAALKAAAGRDVPILGSMAPGSISAEAIIALRPDLIVTTRQVEGANADVSAQLSAWGLPVLFSDTSSNAGRGGGDDLPALLRMWGRVLGEEARAEALIAFIASGMAQVQACLAGQPQRKVYLELQSTYEECCWAAGREVWGALLAQAGGRSLDAVTAPWFQKLHVEQLVVEQPDLYIASGGAFARGTRPAIAPGLPLDEARAGLRKLVARPGLDLLAAVEANRVAGVWTGLVAIRPLNRLFVERVAAWLHPQACRALDPGQTLRALNERFLAVPIAMPVWADLMGPDTLMGPDKKTL